ncbi:protein mono-ADP-ribosyltransferase PARP9-like isoform X2 [Xenia sp. Carnegie-2017]|uniref:protein mono-ADP-ribosyltransferase PARP9-like isoform X2 n=1 Tax=Xenia sp. Carnegie-2017 TaxID=2897299 RepID=UPI001F042D70|nr:protein mono-ADP-ribosyltransferase PARP9-like isoform X2 [Xenia sp. Carnegie-2017]
MDFSRTIVVLNPPSGVGENEFTIHFQKKENGGGDVDEVKLEKGVAFVIFDSSKDSVKVLNHPQKQRIKGCELDVRSYSSWLKTTQESENSASGNNDDVDSVPTKDDEDKATIYVSGLKESTIDETIILFFENKRRTGGGELRDGKEGFERLSPTVARLTYASSKDAENVLKKAKETPFVHEGRPLQVTADYVPTEDRSILMVTNLSPDINVETLKNFVESMKNTVVLKIFLGKHGKAVVVLEEEMKDEDDDKEKNISKSLTLGGRSVSLKFAPLTKGIRVKKIPKTTTKDDVKYKFLNHRFGGGEVTNMDYDQNNGIAKLFFESSSVVSNLVKKDYVIKETLLTVLPLYDDFEELDEPENKITEFHGDILCESDVVDYMIRHHSMSQFDLKSVTYDETMSTFHFTKDVEDPKEGEDLSNRLKVYVNSFGKETLVIHTTVFDQVKLKVIENKVDSEIEVRFEKPNVVLFGRKKEITMKKKDIEKLVDELTSAAKMESVSELKCRFLESYKFAHTQVLRFLRKNCIAKSESQNFHSIAFPAIGTGNLKFTRSEVVKVFFEAVTSYFTVNPQSKVNNVRFVAYGGDIKTVDAFFGAVEEMKPILSATKTNISSHDLGFPGQSQSTFLESFTPRSATTSENPDGSLEVKFPKVKDPEASGLSVKILFDDMKLVESAWSDFLKRMEENIIEHTIRNETIKKIGESEKKKISEVERNFDVTIKVDFTKGKACINGHFLDIPAIVDALRNMLKKIEEKENSKVPDYWETPPDDNVYFAFELQPKSDEYIKVKNAFDKTTSNEIVKIERIQNQGLYELYNVKRKAMKEKYGDADFADKEKYLFHGTSKDNVEKINSGGLNRSFAGKNATVFGKGIYFARDASYSINEKYSSKDANGLRYVYYARVLVGDYAKGDSTMLVPPSKNTADPNETYDSVVNDTKDPSIFVMFKDYQYYTEYLITFK